MPNDAELRRTGISFNRAFTATAMCSPSRASFLTGTYPSRHGVTLTLTEGDLFPDQRNLPDVLRTVARLARSGEVPRKRLASRFARGLLRLGPKSGRRARAAAGHRHARDAPARARLPRRAEGQVAPHQARQRRASGAPPTPSASSATTASPTGSRRTPAATPRPRRSAAGNAGTTDEGWDEDYTRQVEQWLAAGRTSPSRSASSCSLVNPHDVLGYPASVRGRRLRARRSSATSASRCRRPSTRTCATSRPCTR